MIRLNPQRRVRIPNHLALIGALALALSVLACYDTDPQDVGELSTRHLEPAAAQESAPASDTVQRRERFSVSSLLFGSG